MDETQSLARASSSPYQTVPSSWTTLSERRWETFHGRRSSAVLEWIGVEA